MMDRARTLFLQSGWNVVDDLLAVAQNREDPSQGDEDGDEEILVEGEESDGTNHGNEDEGAYEDENS